MLKTELQSGIDCMVDNCARLTEENINLRQKLDSASEDAVAAYKVQQNITAKNENWPELDKKHLVELCIEYKQKLEAAEADLASHKRMFNAEVMSLANIGELIGADENDTAPFNIPEILDDLKKAEFYREQFKSERDTALNVIREAREQKPSTYAIYEENGNVRIYWKNDSPDREKMAAEWAAANNCELTPLYRSPVPAIPIQDDLEEYDAGNLNDFGGGNVYWWQDYIRSELGRAYEFYKAQIKSEVKPS